MTKRAKLLILIAVLVMAGCGGDSPTEPTAVKSPSPSASATPDPRCEPRYCLMLGPEFIQGLGPLQPHQIDLLVLDSFRSPIDNKCDYPRDYRWTHDGPIQPTGPREGLAFRFYPVAEGIANIYMQVGETLARCQRSITIRE